mmetsp:Transcript_1878/g.3402  ORF Transcript_1878/g.3402 Transcript_1878/m.3402 type:complete len:510 (-) Transcript_1878:2414-3943(-)
MTRRRYIPLSRILLFLGVSIGFHSFLTLEFEKRLLLQRHDETNLLHPWIQQEGQIPLHPAEQQQQQQQVHEEQIEVKNIETTNYIKPTIELSNSSNKINSFTECMLQLEEYLYPRIRTWFESSVPIPFSVKVYNSSYYVLLSLLGLDKKRQMPMWRTQHAKYMCNGIEQGEDLGIHWRRGRFTLIVKCPDGIDPKVDNLDWFAIIPRDKGINDTVTYDMKKFMECEKQDIDLFPNKVGKIKTGISVTFKGDRERAFEWATYHHILGFDHVWIYVNEPWNHGKDFPPREYITWIPYNHNLQNYNITTYKKMAGHPMEQFRIASQNEALWRARRLGLDWMAFVDLDELVFLANASDYDSYHAVNNNSGDGPIKTYLHDFAANYGNAYLGIFLQSVPFGRNIQSDPSSTKELLMDYTWRENSSLYTDWWEARNKLIVNVKEVTSVNIHYIGVGGELYKAHVTKLRVNHYKDKDRGVFNRQRDWLSSKGEIIEDTTLPNDYRDKVIERMTRND